MTAPNAPQPRTEETSSAKLVRAAIWVAIGALIAAAFVCVVWVFVGSDNGIIGRAFLTILLLAAFAGAALLDAHLAPRRPAWFALSSMAVWIVLLLLGATMIWMPERYFYSGFGRFVQFLLIVLVLQLALLHVRLFTKSMQRNRTGFTIAVYSVTVGLVVILAIMLVLPLAFHEYIEFVSLYWRFVVAITILAAVGTALLPLVNALFAPKRPRSAAPPVAWPTYVDGVTPLPVLADGTPDWNAYYTGYPSQPYAQPAAPHQQPAAYPHPSAPQAQPASPPPYTPPAAAPSPAAPQSAGSTSVGDEPHASEEPASVPAAGHAARQQADQPMPWAPPHESSPAALPDDDERDVPAPPAQPGYEGYPPPPPLPPRA